MNLSFPDNKFERQDIGYLLTAYADGQLAPEGVMWVEEQLDRTADLRAKLKEIRQLQAGLRTAFAGGAPEFVLDLPRRDALLASAANPPRKKIRIPPILWVGLAASILVMVAVVPQMGVVREMARRSPEARAQMDAQLAAEPEELRQELLSANRETDLAGTSTRTTAKLQEGDALRSYDRNLDEAGARRSGTGRNGLARDGRGAEVSDKVRENADADGGLVADAPANQPFGGNAFAAPTAGEGLAKRERSEVSKQDMLERKKSADAKPATATPKASAAAANPPAPMSPAAPSEPVATVSSSRQEVAQKAAAAEAPTSSPAAPPPPLVAAAKPQPMQRGQAALADGSDQFNKALDDNAALAQRSLNFKEQEKAYAAKNAAPAKPGAAGPQTGKDKAVEQLAREPAEADVAAPINQLQSQILEEKVASDDERTVDLAKGQKEAVASSETGSTGAFMAVGAGGGSDGLFGNRTGGAKRRALAGTADKDADQVLKQAGAIAGRVGDGEPAQVEAQVSDPAVAPGTMVRITRNDLDVVDGKVVSVENGRALIEVNGKTWNEHGAKIKAGDVVSTIHPSGTTVSLAIVQSPANEHATYLRRQVDPQQSLAALRAPTTFEGTLDLAQVLHLIGGEKIGYSLSAGAQGLSERQVKVSLRDEPAARGILHAVRSVGLQAQFTGGLVQVDAAMRPLDPSDIQGYDLPTFKNLFGTSPMQATAVDAIQTVAIDADTASYHYAKARVAAGQPVDPSTIKPEHFINAMPMDYPAAQGPEAFSLFAEAAPSPFARAGTAWGARTALVSIGAVAKPAAADERKPLALTLAIDCSGSMAQAGGLERIQRGLLAFVEHLRAEDRVAIVAFGDQARVILPATPGNDHAALSNALVNLATGGATNCAEGLGLAYQLAAETAAVGVESRVLLATDGGTVAAADDLLRRVTTFKDRGITLVVVGTGATYRAGPLQELATKGDGQHFYVGSDEDAQALFTGKLLPDRLAVLAKDAKLQVTWNPQRVSHARLIGYDQRRLAAKDFRDNTVDAGELSQDTQVTALFEVLLVDGGAGPLGTAAVRYRDMRREQVRELACPLPGTILQSQPSERLRLLACAAATAEWLQRGWWSNVHLITPQEILSQLARCSQPIAAELRAMVK